MNNFARALALPLALLASTSSFAADNWTVRDSTGATVTLRSKDTGSGQAQYHVMSDGTGAAFSSANPLPIVIPGTLPAFASVPAFNLSQIAGAALTLGQKTSAASIPVVLASDGTQATATAQATGNTSLSSIDAKTPALAVLPTLAGQTAGNTSLASIDAKTPALTVLPTLAGQSAGNASLASLDTKATATNTKLDSLITQAAPVSVPGTTIGALVPVPAFQGVTGGVPVAISGTVTTQAAAAMASPAYRIAVAASGNNATSFAAAAKRMLHVYFCNVSASFRSVKFYDKASAPVPGTDAVVMSVPAPAGACPVIDLSGGGFPFANGVAVAITAGAADSDTGSAVAAGDIVGLNIEHN